MKASTWWTLATSSTS